MPNGIPTSRVSIHCRHRMRIKSNLRLWACQSNASHVNQHALPPSHMPCSNARCHAKCIVRPIHFVIHTHIHLKHTQMHRNTHIRRAHVSVAKKDSRQNAIGNSRNAATLEPAHIHRRYTPSRFDLCKCARVQLSSILSVCVCMCIECECHVDGCVWHVLHAPCGWASRTRSTPTHCTYFWPKIYCLHMEMDFISHYIGTENLLS